jgi:hypothetical protein
VQSGAGRWQYLGEYPAAVINFPNGVINDVNIATTWLEQISEAAVSACSWHEILVL